MLGGQPARLVVEAAANLVSAPTRLLVLALAITGLAAAITWVELTTVGEAFAREAEFHAAGGYVAVVASERGLDAARCEQLASHPLVVASGGYRVADQVTAATAPRVTFQRLRSTSGLIDVWHPGRQAPHSTYLVGIAAAEELGLRDGSWLALEGVGPAPTAVFDPRLRNGFVARAIVDPIPPTGLVTECWVEFFPTAYDAGVGWLAAEFAGAEPAVRRAIERGEFAIDPISAVGTRITRLSWVPGALAATALLALVAWARRAEVAVYRAFDVPRVGVLVMMQVEVAILAVGGSVLGAAWATALYALSNGPPNPDLLLPALWTVATFACALTVCGPLAAVLSASGSPASLLKER